MYGDNILLLEQIRDAIRQQTTAMINCFNEMHAGISKIENRLEELENKQKHK